MEQIIKQIKLLILDVDGVLTDGGLYFDESGKEFKRFNVIDGLGIKLLMQNNIEIAIISAGANKTVQARANNLGIKHCYLGQSDKSIAFNKLLKILKLDKSQIAYIGDDIIDLPIITQVGLPIAAANAHIEVKNRAKIITKNSGGNGCIREICDTILRAQNKYQQIIDSYII